MNEPVFYLQIADKDGKVVHLPGGGNLEANLIDLCATSILAKGVGFLRSSKHVEQDIRDGLKDALMGLKAQTIKLV